LFLWGFSINAKQLWSSDKIGKPIGVPVEITNTKIASKMSASWTGAEVALSWVSTDQITEGVPPLEKIFLARLNLDGTRLQQDLEIIAGLSGTTFQWTDVSGSSDLLGVVWGQHQSVNEIWFTVAGCPTHR
jgi:hypothetical protein